MKTTNKNTTGGKPYFTGIYKVININDKEDFYTYALENASVLKKCDLFTKEMRIEKSNKYIQSQKDFDYLIKLKNTKNWQTCIRSGLAKCYYEFINDIPQYVYEGNISEPLELETRHNKKNFKQKEFKLLENPKHFFIVQQSEDKNTVCIDIFPNFYPDRPRTRGAFLKEHKYFM